MFPFISILRIIAYTACLNGTYANKRVALYACTIVTTALPDRIRPSHTTDVVLARSDTPDRYRLACSDSAARKRRSA